MKPKFATRVLLVATLLIAAFVMVACGGGEEETAEGLDVPTPVATFTTAAVSTEGDGAEAAEEPAEEPIEEETEEVEPTEEPTEEPTAEPTATEVPATEVPTPVAEEVITDTGEIIDTADVTTADVATDVAEAGAVTTTEVLIEEVLTETADMVTVGEITGATAITDVESLTATEDLAATEGATDAASGAGTGEAASIDAVMHDIYFGDEGDNIANPPVWTVPAGSEVQLTLDNEGVLEHNWAIVQPGAEVPVPFVEEESNDLLLYNPGRAAAGETLETTFEAPDVGTYTVICTVAGHYPAMQGRLVVE